MKEAQTTTNNLRRKEEILGDEKKGGEPLIYMLMVGLLPERGERGKVNT